MAGRAGFPFGLEGGDGFAGEFEDFEGSDEAFFVVDVDSLGSFGVYLCQAGVKVGERNLAELVAQFIIASGAFEEALEERDEVKGRAADEDEGNVTGFGGGDDAVGVLDESGDRELCGVGDEIEAVMRDGSAVGSGGLGGADVHACVDGHGVDGEDFGLEVLSESHGKSGFAGGGGADDGDELVHGEVFSRESQRLRRRVVQLFRTQMDSASMNGLV